MIAVNLYCLVAIALVKELRKADFYFILVQSLFDFFGSGLYNFLFTCFQLKVIGAMMCVFDDRVNILRLMVFPEGRLVKVLKETANYRNCKYAVLTIYELNEIAKCLSKIGFL